MLSRVDVGEFVVGTALRAVAAVHPDDHHALPAIAAARVGDPLTLARDGDRWLILDADGQALGSLSRAFSPPDSATFISGDIAAILNCRKADSDEPFRPRMRRDTWEVVLPELVYEDTAARGARWDSEGP